MTQSSVHKKLKVDGTTVEVIAKGLPYLEAQALRDSLSTQPDPDHYFKVVGDE